MRSRDGNSTLLFSICSIIFLNTLALSASEYLISYRYVVKDATLFNETLQISQTMTKCEGTPSNPFIIEHNNSQSLQKILTDSETEFIKYIHKIGLHVQHNSVTKNMQNSSTTILTLKTTCFKVDFNDNFARIAPLK